MSTNYFGKSKRPYGGLSRQERILNRREKLLEAGSLTIGRVGYKFTTVKQVCQAASLTERYFYESFENLEALFIACYIEALQEMKSNLVQVIMTSANAPENLLLPCIHEYLKFLHENPSKSRIILLEAYGVSAKMNEIYRSEIATIVDLFTSVNEGYITKEQEAKFDVPTHTLGLLGAFIQIGSEWVLSDYEKPIGDLVEVLHNICSLVIDKIIKS